MRELVIGDIHGCAGALKGVLEMAQPAQDDTIVFLGDYIDRGPDSCAVIDMVLELGRQCRVIPLAGNHEQMLLWAGLDAETFREWMIHGGEETLISYARAGYAKKIEAIPLPHQKFFTEQTLKYWETEERIYVHGALDPELEMADQPEELLYWECFTNPMIHKSGKQIICGHASQRTGLPAVFKKGICIDTWVYGTGWLTCYEPAVGTFYQANNRGLQRTFDLQKLKSARW